MPKPTTLPTDLKAGTPGHLAHTNAVHEAVNGLTVVRNSTRTTSYTLALSDSAEVVEVDSAAEVAITVPTHSAVTFPVGTIVMVCQFGPGRVRVVPAMGVSLRTATSLSTRVQYSEISLRKRAHNEWVVSGDLS